MVPVGFAFAGKTSYIREAWNILDFVIVLSALLGIIAGDAIQVSFIKALRILKILRPLRIIARNKKLKIAIASLGKAIPGIFELEVESSWHDNAAFPGFLRYKTGVMEDQRRASRSRRLGINCAADIVAKNDA